jgi:small-conductance mechanosensitive channel
VLIAIVTFVAYKVFKEILVFIGRRWAARTATEVDDVLIPVIDKIGGVVILIFGVIAVVNYMGYDITFLLAGVGVFGLVIAFAAQDALSNFFSGIIMLLDRPFVEGDMVQIATGETCRVEKIGIRSTRMYDVFQNNYVVLPNNKVVNEKIVNLTEPDMHGIAEIVVNVPHGADTQKVEKILMEIAGANKDVLQTTGREPSVRLSNISESSLEFKLFVWVSDFMTKWRVAHEIRKEIAKRFSKEGIELEMVPRTLYVKKKDAK